MNIKVGDIINPNEVIYKIESDKCYIVHINFLNEFHITYIDNINNINPINIETSKLNIMNPFESIVYQIRTKDKSIYSLLNILEKYMNEKDKGIS